MGDAAAFAGLPARVDAERTRLEAARHDSTNGSQALRGQRNDLRGAGDETRTELKSLARSAQQPAAEPPRPPRPAMRRPRIPEVRVLPFAGELLDVAEGFEEWRGAAERVLRGFALSLLVPQQHYPGSRAGRTIIG